MPMSGKLHTAEKQLVTHVYLFMTLVIHQEAGYDPGGIGL